MIASPPASSDVIPIPPPIPATTIPQTIVRASPNLLLRLIIIIGVRLYDERKIINVKPVRSPSGYSYAFPVGLINEHH